MDLFFNNQPLTGPGSYWTEIHYRSLNLPYIMVYLNQTANISYGCLILWPINNHREMLKSKDFL